ncbi:Na-translocating system protein MpsC family protein [Saccharibacillus kuerlensis]|uniref:Na+-translocating membrane potential-generating system MpsC domain-containing protein n=1 Tax=Saccharibacillus kuerlensis TaxID=459527 RepID=A0ABQ2KZQ0_9BACL|nr:Na-translocating system protein MpsC family protein [Saccharibacillus kuerlensis]GGN97802.1 hypothetical protein GCM10010969_16060 [Saccharibacillus kuerlensis]
MDKQEIVNAITGYTGKLLRKRFGKGPEALGVFFDDRSIVLHLENFMSPIEEVLLAREDEKTFRYTRELMMKSLLPEIEIFFREELGFRPMNLFYDWNFQNSSGIIVGLVQEEFEGQLAEEDYSGREDVHYQIIKVLTRSQRKPSLIDSWWIDSETLLIFRRGLAILLEKELNTLGYTDILKTAKRKLEKGLLRDETSFGTIVGKPMSDLYIDWDFDRDDSIIVCRFKA